MRRTKIKNLSEKTIKYYTEDINFFVAHIEEKYINEISIDSPAAPDPLCQHHIRFPAALSDR